MQYSGFDPYDALRGSRVPAWVRASTRFRQAAIQVRKRSPVDLAWLLGIEPFVMAKTIGAQLTAVSRQTAAGSARREHVTALARALLERADLARLGEGAWGYEFDVQTRWAFYPAGCPNLIATVFVARGLGSAGIVSEEAQLLEELGASAQYLMGKLLHSDPTCHFAYTPTSTRLVHNANLLGAGLLAMSGALSGNEAVVRVALQAARVSLLAQRSNGSWPYGEGRSLGWADSFHTAYNLDGLLQLWLSSGDPLVREALLRGAEHWTTAFFGTSGEPWYYPDRPFPYDIHSAATAVDVAARLSLWGFATADLAERVANWTLGNLVDEETGRTFYQQHRLWTDRRHFARWGDAHWALALASLALVRQGVADPLEAAVTESSGVGAHAV